MAGVLDNRKTGTRILLGAVVLLLGGSMLLYLVPTTPGTGEVSTDAVAKIGDQSVSLQEVRQKVNEYEQQRQIPKFFESRLAQEILQTLVFQKEIEYEAKRLGITVSDQERADRIRQFLPTAFNGGTFVGMDRYAAEVQAKITPDEGEIKASFEKNKSKYQVPEKRVVRYALVDVNQIRQNLQISDDQLKVQYQKNIQQYQVPNRVHAQHILLMTVGKTDAEVEEIKKKTEDILNQLKKGAKFEDLAKKYSEDPGTKDRGGDLGLLVQGQTVPEFEKVAFSLQKGLTSDLVRTQYGFHIIKVLDKETAHTKPFEEVKNQLRGDLVPNLT